MSGRVVIAGGGPAASAAALSLCALGIQPVLLVNSAPTPRGAEAIFEAAFPLMVEIGIAAAAREAGAVIREGFASDWGNEHVFRPGQWMYVDRAAFAQAALALARDRGAEVHSCSALPPLTRTDDGVAVCFAGNQHFFDAAIDATGRSAVWSRPIARSGRAVADVFSAPADHNIPSLVHQLDSQSWYYAMGSGNECTVGLIQEEPSARKARSAAAALPRHLGPLKFLGRRPAFPQWTQAPISGRRIAVGDALLSHSPLAGNGVHFALVSAKLGAEVAASWIRPATDRERAADFYCEMARSALVRHASATHNLPKKKTWTYDTAGNERFRFARPVRAQILNMDGRFEAGDAILLPDGTSVRWLSGVDLLQLRILAADSVCVPDLVTRWSHTGISKGKAAALVQWCVAHQILEGSE